MWAKLFRAEWYKIQGNRWATGCMIWIFPILVVFGTILALIAVALSSSVREEVSYTWTEIALAPWWIPNYPLSLALLLGFAAILFAGEYQWNTWKSIVPRTRRVPLIMVKFITVALFIIFAFTLTSILLTVGMGLVHWGAGATYGPSIDGAVLAEFAEDYGLQMFSAFMNTVIAAGFVSLAAMITRSILGSAITGIVIVFGGTMVGLALGLLSQLLDMDIFVHLSRFLPSYNLVNLFPRLIGETPEGLETPSGQIIIDSQLFNEAMLLCWVVGLVALTAYLFQRQDITN